MTGRLHPLPRSRRRNVFTILLVITAVLPLAACEHDRKPPNVLLVSIDSLRQDHVGCYGYERETTPAIDALARDGALFREAIAPSSWTLPSHVTLFTGKPPAQHGVVNPRKRLVEGTPTLATALHEAGYATAGFVSGPFLRSIYGYADGFDVYDDTVAKADLSASHSGITSPTVVGAAERWLRRWHAEEATKPFFVFLHLWDVHYDYDPPPPYDTLFDPDYRGSVDGRDFEAGTTVHAGMPRRDLEHVIALYDGEIRYTDDHLRQVFALLRDLHEFDDTIVVVTSDHGDEFFEHGNKGHGKSLYGESIRVPMVIRYPRTISRGTVVGEQVRLMDLAPTILGLAGVAVPPGFGTGDAIYGDRDLSPWLTGETGVPFPKLLAFGQLTLYPWRPLFSVRSMKRKRIMATRSKPPVEAYDLAADSGERTNLAKAGRAPATFDTLGSLHDAWLAQWKGAQKCSEPIELERSHVQRLRALGYIK